MTMNTDELEAELHEMEAQVTTNRSLIKALMDTMIVCPNCITVTISHKVIQVSGCLVCEGSGRASLLKVTGWQGNTPGWHGIKPAQASDLSEEDMKSLLSGPASTLPDSLIQPGPLSDESDGTS